MKDPFVGEGELTEILDNIDEMWAALTAEDRKRDRKNAFRARMMASSINDRIEEAIVVAPVLLTTLKYLLEDMDNEPGEYPRWKDKIRDAIAQAAVGIK